MGPPAHSRVCVDAADCSTQQTMKRGQESSPPKFVPAQKIVPFCAVLCRFVSFCAILFHFVPVFVPVCAVLCHSPGFVFGPTVTCPLFLMVENNCGLEKFDGTVTMSISRHTDTLIIGNAPGPKKVIEAHNQSMKIITLAQVNNLVLGDLNLEDLTSADYPESVYAVLDAEKIQVQRDPHSSVSQEQTQDGTAAEPPQRQEDDAKTAGDGHTDG